MVWVTSIILQCIVSGLLSYTGKSNAGRREGSRPLKNPLALCHLAFEVHHACSKLSLASLFYHPQSILKHPTSLSKYRIPTAEPTNRATSRLGSLTQRSNRLKAASIMDAMPKFRHIVQSSALVEAIPHCAPYDLKSLMFHDLDK